VLLVLTYGFSVTRRMEISSGAVAVVTLRKRG
jgi:hypothetical protein